METTYRKIADLITASQTFIVSSHIAPDGDAIGCQLAIYSVLKRLGKKVRVISEDGVPDNFAFLGGSEDVERADGQAADVALVVDSAGLDRIGNVSDVVAKCGTIVNIDHHRSNTDFGDINLVDTEAGATAEIVYILLKMVAESLTEGEAAALFSGIMTDTGCFRFPTTSSRTLRIAADLLELGARPYHLASEIFWNKNVAGMKLLSEALATIETTDGGRVATMDVTKAMMDDSGADHVDTEGFANYPRLIKGVLVGVLLREMGEGNFRVSLRSKETVDVNEIARAFGGGGHQTAAGFRIEGDLGEVKNRIREEVSRHIPDSNSPREAR
jgi:phosphoesterase RecJ-like protein